MKTLVDIWIWAWCGPNGMELSMFDRKRMLLFSDDAYLGRGRDGSCAGVVNADMEVESLHAVRNPESNAWNLTGTARSESSWSMPSSNDISASAGVATP